MARYSMSKNQLLLDGLMSAWGRSLPSWADFCEADDKGRIRVTKNLFVPSLVFPREYRRDLYFFVLVVPSFVIAALIVSGVYAFVWGGSWWWFLGGLAFALYLLQVATNGLTQTMLLAARSDEAFYNVVAFRGAFFFTPDLHTPC